MKAWPKANDSCSPEESPFDTPRRVRHHTAKAKKPATAVAKKAQKALPEKRSGYCECCKSYFNDILLVRSALFLLEPLKLLSYSSL